MELGYIDYLNCYPFYFHMFEKKPLNNVNVVSGTPNILNRRMTQNRLDMSPISSATWANLCNETVMLPHFCLSSIGYVGSVVLISNFGIEELNGKTIGVTNSSHTSAVLLKILLKNYYHSEPVYVQTGPRPVLEDIDAALLIGNDALVHTAKPSAYQYDLGDLWLRKTGYPVVFAVFAVRESIIKTYEKEIKHIIASYHESLLCLHTEKENVINKAKKKYPDVIYDLNHYYGFLQFEFTIDLKKALMFYYESAAELGIIKKVKKLRYLTG